MAFIKIDDYDLSTALQVLGEENISAESIGETLDEEIKIESFLENINNFTQAQLDEFIKQSHAK